MALIDTLKLPLGGHLRGLDGLIPALSDARLLPCLPAILRRHVEQRDRRLVIAVHGPDAQVELVTGQFHEPQGTLDLAGQDAIPAAVTATAKDHQRRIVLMLPNEMVLIRRTSLPAQVKDNLPQVLRYELDRLSPFRPEQVLYDFLVIGGGKGQSRLTVDLALTRRELVDGWLKRLSEAGTPVDQVTWAGAWAKANLLSPEERPRHRAPLLDLNKLLLALVLILGVAALTTPLWQKTQDLETLDSELRRARAQAAQVDQLRQELEKARRGSTEVLRQKLEHPRMLDLLRELTERIPDDTWVQSLEYQNGEVQLRGESGRATALIGLLEGAAGISGVSFRSPVTQVAQTGKERFNLAFAFKRAAPAQR